MVFSDAPTEGLFQLNRHINFFRGLYQSLHEPFDDSFEFWAWLSNQYRLFADLVDLAVQHGIKLTGPELRAVPNSEINYLVSKIPVSSTFSAANDEAASINLQNCFIVLHHPGVYYHMAGVCQVERQKRYEKALCSPAQEGNPGMMARWTGLLADEKLTDHSSLTIEMLTKAYEQFKKYQSVRMTLYLASEIANAYQSAGKHSMAIK